MRQDLAVRLRGELRSLGDQLGPKFVRVLDDPVVDHRNGSDDMRVGVDVVRLPMGRPPGVPDARTALEPRGKVRSQARDPALGFVDAQAAGAGHHREPGGVISAVFELGQPLQQDGHAIPAPHMRNDPAHVPLPLSGAGGATG